MNGRVISIGTITVIIMIIGILATLGFFNSAKIVRVREAGTDSSCPSRVYMSFDVYFINHGKKDTSLCVNVSSDEINFTEDSDCLYMSHADERESKFDFDINTESLPDEDGDNVTVTYVWSYRKNIFKTGTGKYECKYKKKRFQSDLELIS